MSFMYSLMIYSPEILSYKIRFYPDCNRKSESFENINCHKLSVKLCNIADKSGVPFSLI